MSSPALNPAFTAAQDYLKMAQGQMADQMVKPPVAAPPEPPQSSLPPPPAGYTLTSELPPPPAGYTLESDKDKLGPPQATDYPGGVRDPAYIEAARQWLKTGAEKFKGEPTGPGENNFVSRYPHLAGAMVGVANALGLPSDTTALGEVGGALKGAASIPGNALISLGDYIAPGFAERVNTGKWPEPGEPKDKTVAAADARLAKPGVANKVIGTGEEAASVVPIIGPMVASELENLARGHEDNDPFEVARAAASLGAQAALAKVAESPEGQAAVDRAISKAAVPIAVPLRAAGRAVSELAMEDPDLAALKALKVGADTRRAARTLDSIEAARPFLKGVKTQAEAQDAIAAAKREVWAPRQDAIDAHAGETVPGPDGPTTIGQLEAERLQLSAANRALKKGDPAALQLAQQKGLTQADLLQREAEVNTALDSALAQRGVNSALVRSTFAKLADVEGRLRGREGGMVSAPMGLGKIIGGARVGGGVGEGAEIEGHGGFFTEPLRNIGMAARDIAAGRGIWSGIPADISVREGFRTGAEKPVFTVPTERVKGALPAGAIELGPGEGENFVQGTEPARTFGRGPTGQFKRVFTSGTRNPESGFVRLGAGGPEISQAGAQRLSSLEPGDLALVAPDGRVLGEKGAFVSHQQILDESGMGQEGAFLARGGLRIRMTPEGRAMVSTGTVRGMELARKSVESLPTDKVTFEMVPQSGHGDAFVAEGTPRQITAQINRWQARQRGDISPSETIAGHMGRSALERLLSGERGFTNFGELKKR